MELFYTIIESIGVVAFSVSGAMVAIRRKTDLFGVILLAIITSLGGGLTRDVIFSFTPPAFFNSKEYLLLSTIVSIIVFLFARKFSNTYLQNETRIEHINDIFDALGLGIFAVMGVKVAFEQGYEDNALIECKEAQIIRGKELLADADKVIKLKHIITASVNKYEARKLSAEAVIMSLQTKVQKGENLSSDDETNKFDAELYLSELDLDSNVRADLITSKSNRDIEDMLNMAKELIEMHKK